VRDQEERYRCISEALGRAAIPALVNFDYQPEGILVMGVKYPILRMEWVEAQGLVSWLESNRFDEARVVKLAQQVVSLVNELESLGIAHGDLQHGNLLVTEADQLRVIDYDGMYVPALRGLGGSERGLANYQPPTRQDHHFQSDIDRFSGWIIFASLMALSIEPSLWTEISDAGDERLLFGAGDYANPTSSMAITVLRNTGRPPLVSIADWVTSLASHSIEHMPCLDPSLLALSEGVIPLHEPSGGLPDWLKQDSSIALNVSAATAANSPSHEYQEAAFGDGTSRRTVLVTRMTLLLTLLSAVAAPPTGALIGLPFIAGVMVTVSLLLVVLCQLAVGYRLHPIVTAKREARARHKRAVIAEQIARAHTDAAEADVSEIDEHERRSRRDINTGRRASREALSRRRDAVDKERQNTIVRLAQHRDDIAGSEPRRSQVALEEIRSNYVDVRLQAVTIEKVLPPGIGSRLADRLSSKGFKTAADIGRFSCRRDGANERVYLYRPSQGSGGVYVEGIGRGRAEELVAWRKKIEDTAERSAPRQLSSQQISKVRADIRSDLKLCGQEEAAARDEARRKYRQLEQEERDTQLNFDRLEADIVKESQQKRANAQRKLAGARREHDASAQTTRASYEECSRYKLVSFRRYVIFIAAA